MYTLLCHNSGELPKVLVKRVKLYQGANPATATERDHYFHIWLWLCACAPNEYERIKVTSGWFPQVSTCLSRDCPEPTTPTQMTGTHQPTTTTICFLSTARSTCTYFWLVPWNDKGIYIILSNTQIQCC